LFCGRNLCRWVVGGRGRTEVHAKEGWVVPAVAVVAAEAIGGQILVLRASRYLKIFLHMASKTQFRSLGRKQMFIA